MPLSTRRSSTRSLLGSNGLITRHSKSVRSNLAMIQSPSKSLNHVPADLVNLYEHANYADDLSSYII